MKRLSDLMGKAVDQKEVLKAARAQAVFRNWAEVVGETLAAKTTPDRYERGVVWVQASGAAWGQELRLRADVVLGRLNDLAGEPGLFRELQVRIGPMRRDLRG